MVTVVGATVVAGSVVVAIEVVTSGKVAVVTGATVVVGVAALSSDLFVNTAIPPTARATAATPAIKPVFDFFGAALGTGAGPIGCGGGGGKLVGKFGVFDIRGCFVEADG